MRASGERNPNAMRVSSRILVLVDSKRKLLTPDNFRDLDVLANRLIAFEARYNSAARPFDSASTATTSTDSSPGSPHDPRQTNGREH